MRIYTDINEAFREVERDVAEMGVVVHTDTYQDKDIRGDDDRSTKEVQGYGFKIVGEQSRMAMAQAVAYLTETREDPDAVMDFIEAEVDDRTSGVSMNPGNAFKMRRNVWDEFLRPETGTFHYTYAERFAPQYERVVRELLERPDTRQAIITIHSNIQPDRYAKRPGTNAVCSPSVDMASMGGAGRVPCSMYYQFLLRNGRLDMVYAMRSCDLLCHFPVDVVVALMIRARIAERIGATIGDFTYFAGSLHAYKIDMDKRKVF